MRKLRKQNIKQIKLALKMGITLSAFVYYYAKIWRESCKKSKR